MGRLRTETSWGLQITMVALVLGALLASALRFAHILW